MLKNVDMNKLTSSVSKAKKQLGKELGLEEAGKTTGMKVNSFEKCEKSTERLTGRAKELNAELNKLVKQLYETPKGEAYDQLSKKIRTLTAEFNALTRQSEKSTIPSKKYDEQAIQNYIDNFKTGTVKKTAIQVDTSKVQKAETEVDKLSNKISKVNNNKVKVGTSTELNKSNTFANKLKNAMQQVKKQIEGSGNSTKKISSGLNSAKNMVSKMEGSLKVGLGQILKIAGALFSLRSIYSILSNSANAWLSSQNAQAKQLSANIDYMKYALGSTLAPILQWIVNLVYQALKGIQSLVYALTGVNIFANASAKAYSNMAGSAKKAKDETKQLAGIHSEISNIQDSKGSDSGSGGTGDVTPNIDLSKLDNKLNSFLQKLKEGKWFEAGVEIGNKINESLEKIPWESIKKKASNIGKGMAEFLNGGIATTNWNLVGKTLAEGINTVIEFAYSFITTFDWKKFGQSIGNTVNGFFKNLDWKKVGETIGKGISGIISTIYEFIKTVDWASVAQSIFDFLIQAISNINWGDIVATIFYLLGLSVGLTFKIGEMASKWGEELGEQIRKYFGQKIEEAGGNVAEGLWNGIIEGLGNIAKWVYDNMVAPIIDGFKNAMGIHSPSTVMAELGKNVIEGLLNGINSLKEEVSEIWENIKSKAIEIFTNIKQKIEEIWNNVKSGAEEKWRKYKIVYY